MALFFGNAKLIERYAETSILRETTRIDLQTFAIEQFKKFWVFGYGNESFGQLFKIFFALPLGIFAQHAHNDGIELLGEIGILGVSILFLLYISYFRKIIHNINERKQLARFVLLTLLLITLFIQSLVDFSLHAPGVMVLLMTILSIGLINFKKNNDSY